MDIENHPHRDIIERIMGKVPRLVCCCETSRGMYAHIVDENYTHLWRCRLKYPFADDHIGLLHPMNQEYPIGCFETIEQFIDSTGIEIK